MDCEIKKHDQSLRIALSGDMDKDSVVSWKKIRSLFQEAPLDMVIDCGGVRLITSTALSGLLRLKQFVEGEGRRVAFQGLSDHAREMFVTAGLLRSGEPMAPSAAPRAEAISHDEFPMRRVVSSGRSSPDEMASAVSATMTAPSPRTQVVPPDEEPELDGGSGEAAAEPESGPSPETLLAELDAFNDRMRQRLQELQAGFDGHRETERRLAESRQALAATEKDLEAAERLAEEADQKARAAEERARHFEEKFNQIKKLME